MEEGKKFDQCVATPLGVGGYFERMASAVRAANAHFMLHGMMQYGNMPCNQRTAMRDLNQRQQQIVSEFLEAPTDSKKVADFNHFRMNRTTVYRDIQGLVEIGILNKIAGKAYCLNTASEQYLRWDLSRPPHQRDPVKYNPAPLLSYKPNTSFLLTDKQLRVLEKCGNVDGGTAASEGGKAYERILATLLIDLTHASSNLENVQISWLDTKTLIEFGERPHGLSERQMRIVLNHKEAIGFLIQHGAVMDFVKRDLMDIHSLLIHGLLGDPSAAASLRNVVVRFSDSQYLPLDNPHQLQEAFELFCEKAQAISNPHEQAFFAMLFIPYIQPFQDGNKRTSRIAMNIPLVKNRLAPFSFSDIKGGDYLFGLLAFYERNRSEFLARSFIAAYQKSSERYRVLLNYVNDGGALGSIV